jgi:hypothetical protein
MKCIRGARVSRHGLHLSPLAGRGRERSERVRGCHHGSVFVRSPSPGSLTRSDPGSSPGQALSPQAGRGGARRNDGGGYCALSQRKSGLPDLRISKDPARDKPALGGRGQRLRLNKLRVVRGSLRRNESLGPPHPAARRRAATLSHKGRG